MLSTSQAVTTTAFVGIILSCIPTILNKTYIMSANACEDLEYLDVAFTSTTVQNGFLVGFALACLIIFDIAVDFLFMRQRIFESSLLFGIGISIWLPDVVLIQIRSVQENLTLIMSVQSCQGIGLMTFSFLLLCHFGPNIWNSKFTSSAFIFYTASFILQSFVPLFTCGSQSVIAYYNTLVVLKLIFVVLIAVPSLRWFYYLVSEKRFDISYYEMFCTGQLLVLYALMVYSSVLVIRPGKMLGAIAMLAQGPGTYASWNYAYLASSILMVSIYGRLFQVECIRSEEGHKLQLEQKRVFIRYISHEMRTPLNTAMMGLQLLKKEIARLPDNPSVRRMKDTLVDVDSSCVTAVATLDELLDYEKLDAGLMTLHTENVAIRAFVQTIFNSFRVYAVEKGVELTIKFNRPDGTDCDGDGEGDADDLFSGYAVTADKSKLSQVLRNMLSNALKFTPVGGEVVVDVDLKQTMMTMQSESTPPPAPTPAAGSQSVSLCSCYRRAHSEQREVVETRVLVIRVTDNGPGISKENQRRLFKEVIQFEPGRLQGGKGSGLGLWISNKIMKLHGGKISVSSEGEGLGSSFTMTLEAHRVSGEETMGSPSLVLTTEPAVAVVVDDVPTSEEQNVVISTPNFVVKELTPIQDDTAVSTDTRIDITHAPPLVQQTLTESGPCLVMRLRQQSYYVASEDEIVSVSVLQKSSPQGEEFDIDIDDDESEPPPVVDKVLVVDDAALNRKMLVRLLASNGFESDIAEDGRIAVDMVRKSIADKMPYRVIFMDFQMPNMDGPMATRIIRELGFRGPIIGVTGNALHADTEHFMYSGANKVLLKPVLDFDAVLAAMASPLVR